MNLQTNTYHVQQKKPLSPTINIINKRYRPKAKYAFCTAALFEFYTQTKPKIWP
jgi:hypothetical protein